MKTQESRISEFGPRLVVSILFLWMGVALSSSADAEDRVIQTNDAFGIRGIAVSPDGKHFVTAHGIHTSFGARGHAVLWETESRKKVATIPNLGPIDAVAFSPDGKTFIAAGSYLHVIDVSAKKVVAGFSPGNVLAVAFSPDGKSLATCHKARASVYFWDPVSGKLLNQLNLRKGTVVSIAYSCDGKLFATSSVDEDKAVTIWNTESWTPIRTLSAATMRSKIRFSPKDPNTLFVSRSPQALEASIISVDNSRNEVVLRPINDICRDAAFSDDGKYVFLAQSSQLTIWDVESGKRFGRVLSDVPTKSSGIDAVAYLQPDKAVIFGDRQTDGQTKVVILPLAEMSNR